MRILLIGATGQLGTDLVKANPGHEIIAPTRAELNLARRDRLGGALREARADWVINTAAFHNVPQCEAEPREAFEINCLAVRDLALACLDAGARLVTISTDYVFGGDKRTPYLETDCPAPLQVYGISKLAGEQAAVAAAPDHVLVVRTCGLYGEASARAKGGNFVDNRVRDLAQGGTREMACEQTVCPTATADLAGAIHALIAVPAVAGGVYHLTNDGACTWHAFTQAIYTLLGRSVEVKPVDRGGRTGAMRRPLYSVLANSRARALGITLAPWQDALARYLRAKGHLV